MRTRTLSVIAAILAAACNSDSNGDGDELRGRLHGADFTPEEVVFVEAESEACTSPIEFGNTALLLGFSAGPGMCALAADPCTGHRDFEYVVGVVAHARLFGDAPGIAPGSYPVVEDPGTMMPDEHGEVRAARFVAVRTGAACLPDGAPMPASGTVDVEEITDDRVRGRLDVTFADGELKGPFEATRCDADVDVCGGGLETCHGSASCPP